MLQAIIQIHCGRISHFIFGSIMSLAHLFLFNLSSEFCIMQELDIYW